MSIAYPVRVSSDKNHSFLEKFIHFFGVCRLGYLKCHLCKGSRSELFPIPLPRKGMETWASTVLDPTASSFPIPLPRKGMETRNVKSLPFGFVLSFRYLCPERGWKLLVFPLFAPPNVVFPIPLPRKGMETNTNRIDLSDTFAPIGDRNFSPDCRFVSFRYLCPERGWKLFYSPAFGFSPHIFPIPLPRKGMETCKWRKLQRFSK